MSSSAAVNMRDRAIIAGIGRTKVDRDLDSDVLGLIGRALRAAAADAGLARADIDGLMINNAPWSASMDKLPEMLGLPNVHFAFQSWAHGRMQPTCIATAVWAVMTGQADYVACISTSRHGHRPIPGVQSSEESYREGGGPHLEAPPYGMLSISAGAALAMRRYLIKYGGEPEELGAVAIAQRQWAQLQPEAYFHGRPLMQDDYLRSPFIVEPLRILDHCIPGNAAFCIIVTSAERASAIPKKPVYISGYQGSASGREVFVFARTGLGVGQQSDMPYRPGEMDVYRMAGVGPEDVEILGIIDPFSPLVVFGLEEFGFCAEGEALTWIQGGRIAPGGELPINTCGGGLSDVESVGWGHQIDMVRQLRGEAGAAQVPGVRVCQYVSTDRSSIILTTR